MASSGPSEELSRVMLRLVQTEEAQLGAVASRLVPALLARLLAP